MARYFLIESRDPFDSKDADFRYGLARDRAKAGNDVTLFLVQNGVLPVRPGARSDGLAEVAAAGVETLADEFSLRDDGLDRSSLELVEEPLLGNAPLAPARPGPEGDRALRRTGETLGEKKTLSFALMDAPYENARSTTALRIVDAAARRATTSRCSPTRARWAVPFTKQAAHANAVHGRSAEEEDHPLPHP